MAKFGKGNKAAQGHGRPRKTFHLGTILSDAGFDYGKELVRKYKDLPEDQKFGFLVSIMPYMAAQFQERGVDLQAEFNYTPSLSEEGITSEQVLDAIKSRPAAEPKPTDDDSVGEESTDL